MPMWIVYAIIPVAFLNTLIRLLQRPLKGKFGPDAVSVEEEI